MNKKYILKRKGETIKYGRNKHKNTLHDTW